jgi:hypothetical protein
MKDLIKIQIDLEKNSIEGFIKEIDLNLDNKGYVAFLRGVISAKKQGLEMLKNLLKDAEEND